MPKLILNTKQLNFIKRNYLKISGHDLDKKLGLTMGTCDRQKKRLGLKVPRSVSCEFRAKKLRGRTSSTPKIDRYLKKNYLKFPVNTIAKTFGRSETMIKDRLRQLGLKIPKRIREQRKRMCCFKKGQVPMTKGMKQTDYMTAEAIERTKATRFQKGSIPKNAIGFKDGDISFRKHKNKREYWWIRIAKSIWIPLHQYKWEQVNGKLPKGHCLWFKDQDVHNTEPDNMELITRKENYIRNSAQARLTDRYVAFTIAGKNHTDLIDDIVKDTKLVEAKRQLIILNRTINETRRSQAQA